MKNKLVFVCIAFLITFHNGCSDRFSEDDVNIDIRPLKSKYYTQNNKPIVVNISSLIKSNNYDLKTTSKKGNFYYNTNAIASYKSNGKKITSRSFIYYIPNFSTFTTIDTVTISNGDQQVSTYIYNLINESIIKCEAGAQYDEIIVKNSQTISFDVTKNDSYCDGIANKIFEFNYLGQNDTNGNLKISNMGQYDYIPKFGQYEVFSKDYYDVATIIVFFEPTVSLSRPKIAPDIDIITGLESLNLKVSLNDELNSSNQFREDPISIPLKFFLAIDKFPKHGIAEVKGGEIIYTKTSNFTGIDSFYYYYDLPILRDEKALVRIVH
jgi:hypothetical protein